MRAKEYAYKIDLEHREEIVSLQDWLVSAPVPSKNDDRTRYIFELYNEYINTGRKPETMSCGYCRQKIKRIFLQIINIYNEYGISSDQG